MTSWETWLSYFYANVWMWKIWNYLRSFLEGVFCQERGVILLSFSCHSGPHYLLKETSGLLEMWHEITHYPLLPSHLLDTLELQANLENAVGKGWLFCVSVKVCVCVCVGTDRGSEERIEFTQWRVTGKVQNFLLLLAGWFVTVRWLCIIGKMNWQHGPNQTSYAFKNCLIN